MRVAVFAVDSGIGCTWTGLKETPVKTAFGKSQGLGRGLEMTLLWDLGVSPYLALMYLK